MRRTLGSVLIIFSAAALGACGGDDGSGGSSSGGTGAAASGGSGGSGASAGSGASGGGGGTSAVGGTGGGGGAFRVALSVSPFTGVLFKSGASFTDGTATATDPKQLQQLYIAHGANEVYARISCDKDAGNAPDDHSLATALAHAGLAKDLGLPLNPELGLWAHYGDITCQPPPDFSAYPSLSLPGAWATLTIEQIVPVFRDYGALVAQAIVDTGVTVNVWDVGNEVDLGFAGVAPEGFACSTPYVAPDGVDPEIGKQTVVGLMNLPESERIAWLGAHVWPHEAKLLDAVAEGIRSIVPTARLATHMSQSLSPTFATAFYQAMASGGFEPDVIGFSLYPSASAAPNRLAGFKATVSAVQAALSRPVFIAEYAYPAGPTSTGPYASWTNQVPAYPLTEDGQAALLHDLAAWAAVSNVEGIRPWAPDVFVESWAGFALFEPGSAFPVKARKSLDSVAQGIAKPDATAFHD